MRAILAAIAASVFCVFTVANASAAQDPFVRYMPPSDRIWVDGPVQSAMLQRAGLSGHLERAEGYFAARRYIDAAFEYEGLRGNDARDFGLLADQYERAMTCLLQIRLTEKGVQSIIRFLYDDGSTRFVLMPSEPFRRGPAQAVLINPDGTRHMQTVPKYKNLEPPSLPAEWYNGLRDISSLNLVERWNIMVAAHSVLPPPEDPRFLSLVETCVRVKRVEERWVAHQGDSQDEILASYRAAALEKPTVVNERASAPTLALIMLADYCVRHPDNRDPLVRDLVAMLLGNQKNAGLALTDIVTLNRFISIGITASELIAELQRTLTTLEREAERARAGLALAELFRYESCVHYMSVMDVQPDAIGGVERYLLPPTFAAGKLGLETNTQGASAETLRLYAHQRLRLMTATGPDHGDDAAHAGQPDGQ